LIAPALGLIAAAQAEGAIADDDATDVVLALQAGDDAGLQGTRVQRAVAGAVADATNFLLAAASIVAARLAGITLSAEQTNLSGQLGAALVKAEPLVTVFAGTMARDLAHAVASLVGEARQGSSPAVTSAGAAVPDDVENAAWAEILEGRAPPAAWRPFIHNLNFINTSLEVLTPLAGLTALQYLVLSSTQVSDVAPLAGLTALQNLDLTATQVSDVAPLAHIRQLSIYGVGAADAAPAPSARIRRYLRSTVRPA
jgi:hypothetical protein